VAKVDKGSVVNEVFPQKARESAHPKMPSNTNRVENRDEIEDIGQGKKVILGESN